MDNRSTHSDLANETVESLKEGTHYQKIIEKYEDLTIEQYQILKSYHHIHQGQYIEFFFKDYFSPVIAQKLQETLQNMINQIDYPTILIVGLGNMYLTSDAIGPRSIRDIRVTHYLDDSIKLEKHYYDILAITPGVMYQTGMETVDIIQSIVDRYKIDIVIAIDALCATDYQKLGHVIQINDVGIHPGSGIGNHRKAINEENLGCKVIAIGVPTVIYASSLLKDTFGLIKDYFGDSLHPSSRLKVGKRQYQGTLTKKQEESLLGYIGQLDTTQLQSLLFEILDPIDCNYVMSDKQIDEHVEILSSLIAKSLNGLRYK
ncbi:MAG: GPR endopeptidase [Faecalibacillus sp.]